MPSVIDILVPVFSLIGLGYLAGRLAWLRLPDIEGLSRFVFNFAIPVMLFQKIAVLAWPDEIPWNFLTAYYGGTLAIFLASAAFAVIFMGRTVSESAIFGMAGAYSNVVLLGIPIVLSVFGDAATLPLFLIVSSHAAVMFFITTLAAESDQSRTESTTHSVGQKIWKLGVETSRVLLRNPIFMSLILGMAFNLAGLDLPAVAEKSLELLGSAALPCAIFSIGATLSIYSIRGETTTLTLIVGVKNLAHPLLVWFLCDFVFNLTALWTGVAVILAACPSGINVYLFAQRYNVLTAVSAASVVLSTFVSMFTLTLLLSIWLG